MYSIINITALAKLTDTVDDEDDELANLKLPTETTFKGFRGIAWAESLRNDMVVVSFRLNQ